MQLNRTPDHPPVIQPLPAGTHRPKWSVMIPAYNCSRYLPQAIESVLAQFPADADVQIEVIDDFSTDEDVAALVAKIGGGRVAYFRQAENMGSLRNFETCINRAKGEWIHILHGDDFVEPEFYATVDKTTNDFADAAMIFTGYFSVDEFGKRTVPSGLMTSETGVISNWLEIIATSQQLQPPCAVVKRTVYETIGSFYAVHYGEDWEMWVRIALNYKVVYIPQHLANYRVHAMNISSQSFISGQHIKDITRVLSIIYKNLPRDRRKQLNRRARYNWSCYFARTADRTYSVHGLPKKAMAQSMYALDLHFNRITLFYVLKTAVKIAIRKQ